MAFCVRKSCEIACRDRMTPPHARGRREGEGHNTGLDTQMVKSRAARHFEGLNWDLELFAFRPAETMDECTLNLVAHRKRGRERLGDPELSVRRQAAPRECQ